MSEERWELCVTPTAAETYEAMVLAGKVLLQGRERGILIASPSLSVFAPPLGQP